MTASKCKTQTMSNDRGVRSNKPITTLNPPVHQLHSARPRPRILQKRRPSRPESGAEQRAGDTQTHAIIHPKRIQRHCGNFTSHAWPCGSERRRIDLCLFRGCRRRRHVGRLPPPPHFTASSALAPA
jgi:hypothetical protein